MALLTYEYGAKIRNTFRQRSAHKLLCTVCKCMYCTVHIQHYGQRSVHTQLCTVCMYCTVHIQHYTTDNEVYTHNYVQYACIVQYIYSTTLRTTKCTHTIMYSMHVLYSTYTAQLEGLVNVKNR